MQEMRTYLDNINNEKLEIVKKVKLDFVEERISLTEARAILKEKVVSLKPYEIAIIEQDTIDYDQDLCKKEDIQSMMDLFSEVMDTSRPDDLADNHPIMCYYRENDAMRKVFKEIEDLLQYPIIKNQWYEIYDKLEQYRLHLSRKQNQLYSILEKKGFNRPSNIMWTLDDYIRDEIKEGRQLLDEGKEEEFKNFQKTLVEDIDDLMSKEENILFPTSLSMISHDEFEYMKSGDREIGFALISVDSDANKADVKSNPIPQTADFAKDLAALLSKHGYQSDDEKTFDVSTGQLTLNQINLIYKHLPVDLSYVDEDEIVKFYSDTKHRVFPRSKNVIGRDVKNCHSQSSVHVVEEIIEKFRSGKESFVEFWINKPDIFIYICYAAVREEDGTFKGILEMMQDCTHIRSLEGSRTLLTWESEEHSKSSEPNPKDNKIDKEVSHEQNQEIKNHLEISADTKLSELLALYPWLKQELPDINPKFSIINTALAKIMIPKATISMMAERGEMNMESLISEIKNRIDSRT